MELPHYDELPASPLPGARCAWGLFGPHDELGRLNLVTDRSTRLAAQEVRSGRRFNLCLPLDLPESAWNTTRQPYRHHVFSPRANVQDDYLDSFFPQRSTQWDGLRHIRVSDQGFWNGMDLQQAGPGGARLGIDRWAQHGIATRGVLADVASFVAREEGAWDVMAGRAIGPELLQATLHAQGVSLRSGDVLLLRTGYADAYLAGAAEERQRMVDCHACPGLAASEAMAAWLWDHGVAAIAADNPGVEVIPVDRSAPTLHQRLIPLLGFCLGEWFVLGELARHCAAEARYTCMLVGVPLNLPGGVGSPANAIALT